MAIGEIQNQNDSPLGSKDYRPPVDPTNAPADGEILAYSTALKAYISQPGVTTSGFTITDDSGDGSVSGDCNATDFTGQSPVIGQAADLKVSSINTFAHKAVAYNWIGPTGVTVGIGGSYIATAGDFVGVGTADHNILVNRNQPDQHQTADITGLDADQIAQDTATALVQTNLDTHEADVSNPHNTLHSQLTDASDPNLHPTSSISGLDTKQADQDTATAQVQTNLDDHVAAPDPHPQYALETAVLDNFVLAGYGGIGLDVPVAVANIGAVWQDLTWDVALLSEPIYVTQDFANNGMNILREGVWQINVKISLTFAESNGGRQLSLRIFNSTEGAAAAVSFNFFVGRNQSGANLNFQINARVKPESVGDLFRIQVSSASDSFTLVNNIGSIYELTHVSKALGL